jgi:hypothetical protein
LTVMASSMKLAYPLNDVLPNVEHTRDRLLAKVFEFRQSGLGKVIAKDEDYELLYAYGKAHPTSLTIEAVRLTSRQHW